MKRWLLGLIGAVLLVDALALMAIGKFNLGVILPFAIGVAFLGLTFLGQRWQVWISKLTFCQRLWKLTRLGFFVWLISVAVFFALLKNVISTQSQGLIVADKSKIKSILVLGSGTPYCQPSRALVERLDVGLVFAKQLPNSWVTVSGGVDFGLKCSEAQVMADYLKSKGFDMLRIILEPESASTHENMLFTQRLLAQKGISAQDPIAIVTSDFHLLRSEKIAKRAGYTQALMVASPTPIYMRYNAWLREYFAFISGWVLNEY